MYLKGMLLHYLAGNIHTVFLQALTVWRSNSMSLMHQSDLLKNVRPIICRAYTITLMLHKGMRIFFIPYSPFCILTWPLWL
jgi:uncharacterized membrane protein